MFLLLFSVDDSFHSLAGHRLIIENTVQVNVFCCHSHRLCCLPNCCADISPHIPLSAVHFCFLISALLSGRYPYPAPRQTSAASCSEPVGDQCQLTPPACVKGAKNRDDGGSALIKLQTASSRRKKPYCTHYCSKVWGH